MKRQLKLNDKVKKKDSFLYLFIDEVLPENKFVVSLDSPINLEYLNYIMDGDELEFVRDSKDEYYIYPEIGIIDYTNDEDLTENFETKMDIYRAMQSVEFPEYDNKIRFSKNEYNVITVYLVLSNKLTPLENED